MLIGTGSGCGLLVSWIGAHPVPSEVLPNLVLAFLPSAWDSAQRIRSPSPQVGDAVKRRKKSQYGKDKRRKHRHWQVTVFYKDGEKFARVYTDRAKATRFAERQKKSPVVKTARVLQLS